MEKSDWDKAGGVFCPRCKAEAYRFNDDLCPLCWNEVEAERIEKQEKKAKKRYYWRELKEGRMTLTQMKKNRP